MSTMLLAAQSQPASRLASNLHRGHVCVSVRLHEELASSAGRQAVRGAALPCAARGPTAAGTLGGTDGRVRTG